jgi:hypothetical protein
MATDFDPTIRDLVALGDSIEGFDTSAFGLVWAVVMEQYHYQEVRRAMNIIRGHHGADITETLLMDLMDAMNDGDNE